MTYDIDTIKAAIINVLSENEAKTSPAKQQKKCTCGKSKDGICSCGKDGKCTCGDTKDGNCSCGHHKDEQKATPITAPATKSNEIKVGVSQRHIHLSREHLDILFGKGYELTVKKVLMGKEYASEECVTLVGPSLKAIENVRVLGPVRPKTQVEISKTDTFVLKVSPPVRPSGKVEGSERIVIVGPKGSVYLNEGVIIANRHIHLSPEYAKSHNISDNDYVDVMIDGIKPTRFYDVQVRVRDDFNTEMHIDTDDANSAGIKNGSVVTIIKK